MSIRGWYYLHTNGDLIYKSADIDGVVADIRESDFARMLWPCEPEDRAVAWRMLVEATALKATPARVNELAARWACDDADADEYAGRIGVALSLDGNAWCATRKDFINLQESPAGFGATKLEAMAGLCNALGFKPSKMWPQTFHDLVKP